MDLKKLEKLRSFQSVKQLQITLILMFLNYISSFEKS